MDVRVTSGLEGVRQYFQGLPATPSVVYPTGSGGGNGSEPVPWPAVKPQQQQQPTNGYVHQNAGVVLPKHDMQTHMQSHDIWRTAATTCTAPVPASQRDDQKLTVATSGATNDGSLLETNINNPAISYTTTRDTLDIRLEQHHHHQQPQPAAEDQSTRRLSQEKSRPPSSEMIRPPSTPALRLSTPSDSSPHMMRPPSYEMRPPSRSLSYQTPSEQAPSQDTVRQPHEIRPALRPPSQESNQLATMENRPVSRPPSHEATKPLLQEMRPPSHESRPAPYEMRPPSQETRPVSHEIVQPTQEMKPVSHETISHSHQMRPPSQEMRPLTHDMQQSHAARPSPVSHDTRPPSHEMLPKSHQMRPPSQEIRSPMHERIVPVSSYDVRPTSQALHETSVPQSYVMRPPSAQEMRSSHITSRPASHEMRPISYEARPSSQEMRPAGMYEIRPSSHEMRPASHEMRPPSTQEIRPSSRLSTYEVRMPTATDSVLRPSPYEIRPPSTSNEAVRPLPVYTREVGKLDTMPRTTSSYNAEVRHNYTLPYVVNESRASQPPPSKDVYYESKLSKAKAQNEYFQDRRVVPTTSQNAAPPVRQLNTGYASLTQQPRYPETTVAKPITTYEIRPPMQQQNTYDLKRDPFETQPKLTTEVKSAPSIRYPLMNVRTPSFEQSNYHEAPRPDVRDYPTANHVSGYSSVKAQSEQSTKMQYYNNRPVETYDLTGGPFQSRYEAQMNGLKDERRNLPPQRVEYLSTYNDSMQQCERAPSVEITGVSYADKRVSTVYKSQKPAPPTSTATNYYPVSSQQKSTVALPHHDMQAAFNDIHPSFQVSRAPGYPSTAAGTTQYTTSQRVSPYSTALLDKKYYPPDKRSYPEYQQTKRYYPPTQVSQTYASSNTQPPAQYAPRPVQSGTRASYGAAYPPTTYHSSYQQSYAPTPTASTTTTAQYFNYPNYSQYNQTKNSSTQFQPPPTSYPNSQTYPKSNPVSVATSMSYSSRAALAKMTQQRKVATTSTYNPTPHLAFKTTNSNSSGGVVMQPAMYKYHPHSQQSSSNRAGAASAGCYVTTSTTLTTATTSHHQQQLHHQHAATVNHASTHNAASGQYVKPALQEALIKRQQLSKQSTSTPVVKAAETTATPHVSTIQRVKRESPLDLSVKTVKTSADSTADDDVHIVESRTTLPPPSYSQQRLRFAPSTAVAPRVDFSPNFQTSQLTQPALRFTVPVPKVAPAGGESQYPGPRPTNPPNYYPPNYYPSPPVNMPSSAYNPRLTEYSSTSKERKRTTEGPPYGGPSPGTGGSPPSKVPRVDTWRQSIDQQIEQRFLSYTNSKLQQEQQQNKVYNGHASTSAEPLPNDYQLPTGGGYAPRSALPPAAAAPVSGADKRVLSILRNSLEIKGAKEAQKRIDEQNKSQMHVQTKTETLMPNMTAFAATGAILDSPYSRNTPPTKFHLPRAIDSIKYEQTDEATNVEQYQEEEEAAAAAAAAHEQHAPGLNADLDGLAANLAARIRTKAELKQVDPSQLKATPESDSSPPKLTKEKIPVPPPRRRLFSRTDEEGGPHRNNALRSSSETSVFDFRESDSDSEMPVLERQSLDDLRKDRRSKPPSTSDLTEVVIKTEPPESPDPFFAETCDKFMEQLRSGGGSSRRRGRKKKVVEPEVLAQLETTMRQQQQQQQQQLLEVEIKVEKCDDIITQSATVRPLEQTPVKQEEDSDSDVPLIVKKNSLSKCKPTLVDSDSDDEVELAVLAKKREKSGAKIKLDTSSDSGSDGEEKRRRRPQEKAETGRSRSAPQRKQGFGDGSDFRPGWEEEVYRYKQSLRMPAQLINISRPARISTSLPDLDPCPSPSASSLTDSEFFHGRRAVMRNLFGASRVKREFDSDLDSNSSFSLLQPNDSEDATCSSIVSATQPQQRENNNSIIDVLAQRYGKARRRRTKKECDSGPKLIPKSSNPLELLPTPSLDEKRAQPSSLEESNLLGFFRKKTMDNFRDAFRKNNMTEAAFAPIVFKSRTRKETQVMKQRATIREVFGEDRPASAPPMTNHVVELAPAPVNDKEPRVKEEKKKAAATVSSRSKKENTLPCRVGLRSALMLRGNRAVMKTRRQVISKKLLSARRPKSNKSPPNSVDRRGKVLKEQKQSIKEEQSLATPLRVKKEESEEPMNEMKPQEATIPAIKVEPMDTENEPKVEYRKKKQKVKNMRRKFSSGFDYIRKKKKQVKKEQQAESELKPKRLQRASAESVQDVQREIKGWVLNKGIGETYLHRATRLGYTDVIAYCLETLGSNPSPKDNAGYTPLYEACSRGHLDIARLLLLYGASVHESAQGGMRPLHEASENGYVELIRLLLAYGADPSLATYTGVTPLALATDADTTHLLQYYLADLQGKDAPPWQFHGPAACFDTEDMGYDTLADAPSPDPSAPGEEIEMEVSDFPLPNLYTLRAESPADKWVLLQDLSNVLKVKSREALLRQLQPATTATSTRSGVVREMKMAEFLEQAHCCSLLSAGERVNTRASKIALVRYTERVRELLAVERCVLPPLS